MCNELTQDKKYLMNNLTVFELFFDMTIFQFLIYIFHFKEMCYICLIQLKSFYKKIICLIDLFILQKFHMPILTLIDFRKLKFMKTIKLG